MKYDAHLFREIIESEGTITFLHEEDNGFFSIVHYECPTGHQIVVFNTLVHTDNTSKHYLRQLGLSHLIEPMFSAEITEQDIAQPIVQPDEIEVKNKCSKCNGTGVLQIGLGNNIKCELCKGSGTLVV